MLRGNRQRLGQQQLLPKGALPSPCPAASGLRSSSIQGYAPADGAAAPVVCALPIPWRARVAAKRALPLRKQREGWPNVPGVAEQRFLCLSQLEAAMRRPMLGELGGPVLVTRPGMLSIDPQNAPSVTQAQTEWHATDAAAGEGARLLTDSRRGTQRIESRRLILQARVSKGCGGGGDAEVPVASDQGLGRSAAATAAAAGSALWPALWPALRRSGRRFGPPRLPL